jgi:hypothetical protein
MKSTSASQSTRLVHPFQLSYYVPCFRNELLLLRGFFLLFASRRMQRTEAFPNQLRLGCCVPRIHIIPV